MNRPIKAALLSAFIFPGVGHFFLKRYVPGTVLAGTALAGLYFLMAKMLETALQIAEKIQSGEVQPGATTITDLVSKQPTAAGIQILDIATAVLIIAWLIGIVDSYRVGRAQDKDLDAGR
jgi:hypothetical protein